MNALEYYLSECILQKKHVHVCHIGSMNFMKCTSCDQRSAFSNRFSTLISIRTCQRIKFVCLFILFNHGVKACFQLKADFQQGREQYNEYININRQ